VDSNNAVTEVDAQGFGFDPALPFCFDHVKRCPNPIHGANLFAAKFQPAQTIRFGSAHFVIFYDCPKMFDVVGYENQALLTASRRDDWVWRVSQHNFAEPPHLMPGISKHIANFVINIVVGKELD
jgi:hypothetical protein